MIYKAGTARLSRVAADDDTYRITTREDIASLAASITAAGLINPPILLPADSGQIIILSGFRRIRACLDLGWDKVGARFVAADTPLPQCALIAVTDNCAQRDLNLIETSRALNLLSAHQEGDVAVAAAAGQAGLTVAPALIPKIRPLVRLPRQFQQALIDETLSLPMAERLQHMEAADARAVFALFREIRAGLNVQREILDNAGESALRDGKRLRDVLTGNEIMQIRKDAELDRATRTGKIRQLLKRRRYPALTAAEQRFLRRVGELGLPREMALVPPPGFEGRDYNLSLRFRSRAQLQRQLAVMERVLESDAFKEILG
jgi:ParB family chromosome partitioning protein